MSVRTLSLKALLFLGLCQVGRRGLASAPDLREPPKKIAIVGAGIGGTAAAYFLRQEFGPSIKIDVYEADTIGGRLATENIEGQDYEMGGSIIHPLNLHMKHFMERLGLSVRAEVPSKMAIFDGKELMFEESDWFIVNFLRMLWRYGFNALRMHMWVERIMDKFMRIYQYQQFSYSFSSADRLLHAMSGDEFLALLNQTLEEAMLAYGFSQTFINDIVTPISRVNYGQSVRLHAFAGVVSLAGADSGLWAVDGGNKLVCSGLLYHSKAELIAARVTNVALKTRPSKSVFSASLEVASKEDASDERVEISDLQKSGETEAEAGSEEKGMVQDNCFKKAEREQTVQKFNPTASSSSEGTARNTETMSTKVEKTEDDEAEARVEVQIATMKEESSDEAEERYDVELLKRIGERDATVE